MGIVGPIRSVLRSQLWLSFLHDPGGHHLLNPHLHARILNLTDHSLSILGLLCVLLIQNILILAHTLGLSDAVLLALLVPAPFVDLGLGQVCLVSDQEQLLF